MYTECLSKEPQLVEVPMWETTTWYSCATGSPNTAPFSLSSGNALFISPPNLPLLRTRSPVRVKIVGQWVNFTIYTQHSSWQLHDWAIYRLSKFSRRESRGLGDRSLGIAYYCRLMSVFCSEIYNGVQKICLPFLFFFVCFQSIISNSLWLVWLAVG